MSTIAARSPGARGLLFVAGGEDVMQGVYEGQGIGYWSAAFDLVLEKHGWLDFDTATPEALAEPATLARYAALVVAWLPDEAWRPEYVDGVRSFRGARLLEGPLPPALLDGLGLRRMDGQEPVREALLAFSAGLRSVLERRFERLLGRRVSGVRLAPRALDTGAPQFDRHDFAAGSGADAASRVEAGTISQALALKSGFERAGRAVTAREELGVLALVRFAAKLAPGRPRQAFERTAQRALGLPRAPEGPPSAEREAMGTFIRATALAEAARAFGAVSAEAVPALAPIPEGAKGPLELAAWRGVAHAARADASALPAQPPLDASLPLARGVVRRAWLLQTIESVTDAAGAFAALEEWSAQVAHLLSRAAPELPAELEGWDAPELALLAATLHRRGLRDIAGVLVDCAVAPLYDAEENLFRQGRVVAGRLEPGSGHVISPLMLLSLLDLVAPLELPDAADRARRRYSRSRIERWERAPFEIERYEGEGGVAEIVASSGGAVSAAVWRHEGTIVTSFQALAAVVHAHTAPPLEGSRRGVEDADALLLEYALLELLGLALRRAGAIPVRVLSWPWGADFALTVRHDVDRIPEPTVFDRLLAFERAEALGVTWFWIPGRTDPALLARTVEAGHETGLHALKLEDKAEELTALVAAAPAGTHVAGEALHGGGGGGYWLRHASVRAAAEAGLAYTEGEVAVCDLPYVGFPALEEDGTLRREDIVVLTHSATTEDERTVTLVPEDPGHPQRVAAALAAAGLYCQVLNHPDLNFPELVRTVAALPGRRADMTCAQAAAWWRATHTRRGLAIAHRADEEAICAYDLRAAADVADAVLEIGVPPGGVARVELDGAPATWQPRSDAVAVRLSLRTGTPATLRVLGHATPAPGGGQAASTVAGTRRSRHTAPALLGPGLDPSLIRPRSGSSFRDLIETLGIRPERILDVGAGGFTGDVTTKHLVELFPRAHITAIEIVPEKAEALRRRFGETVEVVSADAARYLPETPFDLTVCDLEDFYLPDDPSEFAWAEDAPHVFEAVVEHVMIGLTRPGGVLVTSIMSELFNAYHGTKAQDFLRSEPQLCAFLLRRFGATSLTDARVKAAFAEHPELRPIVTLDKWRDEPATNLVTYMAFRCWPLPWRWEQVCRQRAAAPASAPPA